MDERDRKAAQARARRVGEFRAELDALAGEGVLELPAEEGARVRAHHDRLLAELQERFDVDVSEAQRRFSWGMRIVATLGSAALAAAVYLFFDRIWGSLATAAQVGLLTAAPVAAVAAMEWTSRRERTYWFTGLFGALAFACAVVDLNVLGMTFDLQSTPLAFVVWAAFALSLAYAYGLRSLLAAGLVCAGIGAPGLVAKLSGVDWQSATQRAELWLLPAAATFAWPFVVRHRAHVHFPAVYRLTGAVAAFAAVFLLAHWGRDSFLPFGRETVEALYAYGGLVAAAGVVALGVRRDLRESVYAGTGFFAVFLYDRMFDWWWDRMPRYLFFLVVGAVAVALLLLLTRLRLRAVRGAR